MDDGGGAPDLTERQRVALEALPASKHALADALGLGSAHSAKGYIERLRRKGLEIQYDYQADEYRHLGSSEAVLESQGDAAPVLSDEPVADADPDPGELTDRERYIARELQTGATVAGLADELDERPSVITQHLRDLRRQGWRVYHDDSAGHVAIEGDHLLRSSEHTGTRTRKANRWWETRHNALVRRFKELSTPSAELDAAAGCEDWVCHLTDLHAGDRVRRDDGAVVYETDEIPAVIDYVTEQALALAEKHNSDYDAAHLLWGGDFVTNEGIYEGQFEDLDAWLDEQHDTLVAPLIRQIKAFAERFPTVNVVCQVGNHGKHRASGTSRQANADLICYKHVRNTVAEIRRHADVLENVRFRIGQAQAFRNFALRGGRLRGHLRHGQHRKPQAETSARKKEWLATLREHEFDVAAIGHHHVSGRIPWDGPPVICSPSPKPAGEYVERLGERVAGGAQGVASVFGVSDDGVTAVFPVDTRRFSG